MTDYEALVRMLGTAVPFNAHNWIDVTEIGDGTASAVLRDKERTKNHVGSQHAAGLFGVAEAASGGALVGAMAEHLGELTPLVTRAEISYVKVARGPITAEAELETPGDELAETCRREGRARTDASVALSDERGESVATFRAEWTLLRREQAAG